jgi:hypothetical protein
MKQNNECACINKWMINKETISPPTLKWKSGQLMQRESRLLIHALPGNICYPGGTRYPHTRISETYSTPSDPRNPRPRSRAGMHAIATQLDRHSYPLFQPQARLPKALPNPDNKVVDIQLQYQNRRRNLRIVTICVEIA